jgi:stage III sporulation protein AA
MCGLDAFISLLPRGVRQAIVSVAESSCDSIMEIHIVVGTGSSVRFGSRKVFLGIRLTEGDMQIILSALTGGALYAHRHTIKNGFITLFGAVRVGICGQARYEGNELVGVSNVTSLLVRFPHFSCDFADELCEIFQKCERGMLIFAPASGGKTTALRALIKKLSSFDNAPRISVIDERCEIECEDFLSLDTDIFRGYERGEGMRIALRVMSPEIIAVDEIGASRESIDMLESLFSGVKFIATAHGALLSELKQRKSIKPFFDAGAFDSFVKIYRSDGRFLCQKVAEGDES